MTKRFLQYDAKLKDPARKLRTNMTESERALWSRLRGKQILEVQFYRQKPIGDYIVDFYAPKARLVIEVDGSQHCSVDGRAKDQVRDEYLGQRGIKVLRFNGREVLKETDGVVEQINNTMKNRLDENPL